MASRPKTLLVHAPFHAAHGQIQIDADLDADLDALD